MTKTSRFDTPVPVRVRPKQSLSQSVYPKHTLVYIFFHLDSRVEGRHSCLHAAQESQRATEAEVGTDKSRPNRKKATEKLYGFAVVAGVHLRLLEGDGGGAKVSAIHSSLRSQLGRGGRHA